MAKKMTQKQALKKAVDLWGKRAGIQYNPKVAVPCMVGVAVMGLFFEVKGQGNTWEEAFKNWEEKEEKLKKRYAK